MTNFLRFLRLNGISQSEFAGDIGLSKSFVSQICRGERRLPKELIEKVKILSAEKRWTDLYLLESDPEGADMKQPDETKDYMELDKKQATAAINKFFETNDVSKKDVAQCLGVTPAMMTQICKGSCPFPAKRIKQLKEFATEKGLDFSMFYPKTTQVEVNTQGDVYSNVDGEMNINGNKEGMRSLSRHIEILQAALDDANKRNATLLKMLDDEREKFLKMLDDERTRHAAQMQKLIEKL